MIIMIIVTRRTGSRKRVGKERKNLASDRNNFAWLSHLPMCIPACFHAAYVNKLESSK